MPPKETHEIKMMYAVYADGTQEPIVIDEIKDLSLEEAEPILEEHNFVKVVRCKDCKHRPYLDKDGFIEPENGICPCINDDDDYYSWIPEDDWFCADGEREEDGR